MKVEANLDTENVRIYNKKPELDIRLRKIVRTEDNALRPKIHFRDQRQDVEGSYNVETRMLSFGFMEVRLPEVEGRKLRDFLNQSRSEF